MNYFRLYKPCFKEAELNEPGCIDWKDKMTGLNSWFLIEILSFYGYILGACIYVITFQVKSSLGWVDKT